MADSFLVTKLFRLSGYFVRCLSLCLVPQIFLLNIYLSSPSALFVCPTNCCCLFLMVLSRDLLYPTIFITSCYTSFQSMIFSLLMYHISAASSLLSRSFVSVQHSYPFRRMGHNYVGFQSVDTNNTYIITFIHWLILC